MNDVTEMRAQLAKIEANHEVRITHLEQSVEEIKNSLQSMSESIERAVDKWESLITPIAEYITSAEAKRKFIVSGFIFISGFTAFIWVVMQIVMAAFNSVR